MNMNEQAADLLDDTADVLLIDGWTQKVFSDADGKHCLIGAASNCLGGRVDVFSFALESLAGKVGNTHTPFMSLTMWNDKPGRTEDEVHDLLRNTAKELREPC